MGGDSEDFRIFVCNVPAKNRILGYFPGVLPDSNDTYPVCVKPTRADSHCRAPLRLPLPPSSAYFLTLQFLWRQAVHPDEQEGDALALAVCDGTTGYHVEDYHYGAPRGGRCHRHCAVRAADTLDV